MSVLYPNGYQRQMITLERMRDLYEDGMHPEYARRFFPYMESKGGLLGMGGADRPCPSAVSAASMRCESFHQLQRFASGLLVYAAGDLVARNGDKIHRAPTWQEVDDAPAYGLHAFIGKDTPNNDDDESWHLQCLEMRGFLTWKNRGRPDPLLFPLPIDPPPTGGIAVTTYKLAGADGNGFRALDTRDADKPKPNGRFTVPIADPLADGAATVRVNLTVTEPDVAGNLAAWGFGENPGTSKVNWTAAWATIANEVEIRLSGFQTFEVQASCPLHLVVDVVSYGFA